MSRDIFRRVLDRVIGIEPADLFKFLLRKFRADFDKYVVEELRIRAADDEVSRAGFGTAVFAAADSHGIIFAKAPVVSAESIAVKTERRRIYAVQIFGLETLFQFNRRIKFLFYPFKLPPKKSSFNFFSN